MKMCFFLCFHSLVCQQTSSSPLSFEILFNCVTSSSTSSSRLLVDGNSLLWLSVVVFVVFSSLSSVAFKFSPSSILRINVVVFTSWKRTLETNRCRNLFNFNVRFCYQLIENEMIRKNIRTVTRTGNRSCVVRSGSVIAWGMGYDIRVHACALRVS